MRKLVSYKSSIIVAVLAIALFFAGQTDAQVFAEGPNGNGPEVRSEDGMPWADAMRNGMIKPVGADDGMTGAAKMFYDEQVAKDPDLKGFKLVDTRLSPDVPDVVDGRRESHTAMVMSWLDPSVLPGNFLGIGAWDLVYPKEGVDLRGMMIHFSILPVDVWDVSLELIDVNGNSRGWFIFGPAPFWANAWIDPSISAAQPPFTNSFEVGPFDITKVVAIRLDESWMGDTLSTDIDPTTGQFNPWNAWDHLRVEPIPRPICDISLEIVPRTDGGSNWNFVLWDPWQDVWWETWIVIHDFGIFPLWQLPIPPIPEERPFEISIPIPPLPPFGRVAILTALSTPDMGLGCGDIAIFDTGSPRAGGSLSAGEIQESLSAIKPSMGQ